MKKTLITLAIVLLAVVAQAQTALKVHNNGQISLQSATTSYGIQIPNSGVISIEPNIQAAYQKTAQTKTFHPLTKSWTVRMVTENPNLAPTGDVFYVNGNGNTYAFNYYSMASSEHGGLSDKGFQPIVGASELTSALKGYYMDTPEFSGITFEELESCEEIVPDALEGILHDLEINKTIGLDAEVLEHVLPEAVRHDPNGNIGINYNAVVAVLVEAFKEQQAKIEQLESILRENQLLK